MPPHPSLLCGLFVALLLVVGPLGCSKSPARAPTAIKAVGNASCPVSDKPVAGDPAAPTFSSDFEGWRVGFMCPVCKGEFDGATLAKKKRLLAKAHGR
jgi:hypothetical protein